MSAVCVLSLNASAMAAPTDTLDRYVINGQKVEKFDGSQLVGKNVSDYKVIVADGNVDGKVLRMHLIRTDGQKVKEIKSAKTTDVTSAVYVINGKKGDKEDLNKIKPESIASITIYKPGSKEALELSGDKNISVVKVETKE